MFAAIMGPPILPRAANRSSLARAYRPSLGRCPDVDVRVVVGACIPMCMRPAKRSRTLGDSCACTDIGLALATSKQSARELFSGEE